MDRPILPTNDHLRCSDNPLLSAKQVRGKLVASVAKHLPVSGRQQYLA
jgi:hypothetical protein